MILNIILESDLMDVLGVDMEENEIDIMIREVIDKKCQDEKEEEEKKEEEGFIYS